ncbi:hypothetical protein E4U47_001173 [Claviceps purpurea]|nr:hypothetical protein E4U47_001173 [Claviceps purpurea]
MLLRVQEDASPLCLPSKTTYWREGPPARYAKRRHTTQDPEQDADDQDDGASYMLLREIGRAPSSDTGPRANCSAAPRTSRRAGCR